jgi:hypothetical protein
VPGGFARGFFSPSLDTSLRCLPSGDLASSAVGEVVATGRAAANPMTYLASDPAVSCLVV